jgi:hypothetical protein
MTPRTQPRLLIALAAAICAFIAIVPVARAATPAPGYSQFAGCPSPKSENPAITNCLRTEITGGQFKIGNKSVPITQPLVLSGGSELEGANFSYNSKGGLSHVKLQVPGGVIGLTGLDWLINFLNIEQLKLFAEPQLAGAPQILGPENVVLPLKIHLINSILGNNCFIGSSASPVKLNLTTGTSGKLTGKSPTYEFDPILEILHARNGAFVDNTFTAPGASGCQLTLLGFIPIDLDPVVNLASALPAGSGTNEAVQNYNLELVASNLVYP